jgi:RND family efflux transporter MFP subunit
LVALAVLATASCAKKAVESVATDEDVPVGVQAAAVVDSFEAVVAATGRVTPAPGADWTITAPEAARIEAIPKNDGESVQTGDLLVQFEIPSLAGDLAARQSDLDQARAHITTAQAARDRIAGLVQRGINPQKDLEAADLELTQAQATARQAQVALDGAKTLNDRAVVKARFPGIVVKHWHNVGDLVDASATDPVLRVIDPTRLEVVMSVTVADLGRISAGRAVRITNPSTGAVETGKVISLPAAVDPSSSTSDVRASFDKATKLAAGTPVSVDIIAERRTKAIVIPTVAILHEGAETFVMVAGQDDDKSHKTPVTLGVSSGGKTEILKGVNAGDLVIVRGQEGLPDEAELAITK